MAFFTRSLQDLPTISVNDVYRIIQTFSKAPTSKKDKGFKLYVSNYINKYEVSNKEAGEVTVRAECFQSMRKSQKPHCLSMVLRESKPVEFQGCQCTCVAGTVLCSHVAALLFQTAHYSQLKLPAVPPVLSCTDTEQKWHKPRTMGIKPGPVKDMVVLSAKPRERKIFEGIRSNLYKGTTSPLPLISTLRIQDVYRGLPAEEAPMITTMAVSNDDNRLL
ncbi:uncharacterized protein LOC119422545 [Nematolebias whitei]|uniref:uncharacterized protein LOC119422545 n=1 Tax=Nematolebias whitei TaxID=451745 RepID=UPI0018994A95|nr:uncharacterized protein LOC119422545 [Nematolebias whitei]